MINTKSFLIYLIVSFCFFEACRQSGEFSKKERTSLEKDSNPYSNKVLISCNSFSGFWGWENKENEITFRLKLYQNKDSIWGQYCAAAYAGLRMDCSFDTEFNITGNIFKDSARVRFYSFYGAKNGLASLHCIGDTLIWKIIRWPSGGEVFAPEIARLNILKEER